MKKERENELLAAALKAAEQHGYSRVTLQQIATTAQVAKTLPLHYFGTMTNIRRKIMREAVRVKCLPIVAQGLALGDPHAKKATPELKTAALAICK